MTMMNSQQLKPGWRLVKFGDVVQLSKVRCADPLAEGIERYVGLEHLVPGDLRVRRWGNVADGVTFTSLFKPGQVLFGKRRAYQRKVAVAEFSGICSGDIYVLESKDAAVLSPELLPFICQTDAFFEHAVGTSAGSLSPRTNWTSLADFEFLLAPIEEQGQIAGAFASFYAAIEGASTAEKSGVLLLQAIIDDFFVRGNRSQSIFSSQGREVSPGWCLMTGAQMLAEGVLTALQDGNHGSQYPRSEELGDAGFPYIAASDIDENGYIDLSKTRRLNELRANELRIPPARSGDVILTHNATVGRVAILPQWESPIVASTSTTYYRTDTSKLAPEVLAAFMRSAIFREQLASYMRQSTRNQVPITTQRKLLFLIPPLNEQLNFQSCLYELTTAIESIRTRAAKGNECLRAFSRSHLG